MRGDKNGEEGKTETLGVEDGIFFRMTDGDEMASTDPGGELFGNEGGTGSDLNGQKGVQRGRRGLYGAGTETPFRSM